ELPKFLNFLSSLRSKEFVFVKTLSTEPVQALTSEGGKSKAIYAALLLLAIVGALVTYKATAALGVIHKVQSTGAFQPRTNVLPVPGSNLQINVFRRSLNYFWVIGLALIFGILISGVVRVLVTPRRWTQLLGNGYLRPQLVGGVGGLPLMLCSLCSTSFLDDVCTIGAMGPVAVM